MSLQCYNRARRGYYTLKRENHPVEANRSQTLSSVRLVATHRWINRFVCLAFTYVRYVQRISAGHAGSAVSFDEFSLFVPPTRLCRSLAPSRAVFILQHVASFFFFFFYSLILLFLILYSQLRARRVDRLRACVNTHIICVICISNWFFRPELWSVETATTRWVMLSEARSFVALQGCFRLVGKGRENFSSFEQRRFLCIL